MTITKFDKIAIIPKRCDKCNRLFWMEPYNVFYRVVGIEHYSLKHIKCKECVAMEKRKTIVEYKSTNGYSGRLYGESSMSIYDKDGDEVLHTGKRSINTFDELKKCVDGYPEFEKAMDRIDIDNIEESEDGI